MKLELIHTVIIILFYQDLRGKLVAISVTSINQLYAFIRTSYSTAGSGAFTDCLKFVPAVTYHFCLLLFLILCDDVI